MGAFGFWFFHKVMAEAEWASLFAFVSCNPPMKVTS
jgi:hypothetical protein